MDRVKDEGIGRPPASSALDGVMTLGVLFLLTALLVNKWTLERVFSPDEHISSGSSLAIMEFFEPQVTFTDLAPASGAPKVQQIADTGIEVPDWKVVTEAKAMPLASLELWRPFMDRVDYVNFPWTEFKAAKAKFLDESHNTF